METTGAWRHGVGLLRGSRTGRWSMAEYLMEYRRGGAGLLRGEIEGDRASHVRLHVRRPGGAGPVQGVPDSDGRTAPGERFSESGRAHPSRATDIRVFHDAFRAGLMPVCGKKTRISAA